jgi:transposase
LIVIGIDAHKDTHTAAALDATTARPVEDKTVDARQHGHFELLRWARGLHDQRVWAIEDCRNYSGTLEQLLLAHGERVLRVPPKLSSSQRKTMRSLRSLTEDQRQTVEVVSIDPSEAYRQAIRDVLPHARTVCDHFHLVRGANTALDSVRRERQRQAGRRPRGARRSGRLDTWNPALYRARHRLLKAHERLNGRERRRLVELFQREPVLAEAWGLKEAFRAVYDADDPTEAARRLDAFLTAVDHAGLPAFDAFAKGVRLWRDELLAYFDEPTTNGYAEGVINKVKVIKRRAYGIPTFTAFRDRVLLACG